MKTRKLTLNAGGRRLNAAWLGPSPDQAPTLVFLHEGLGSIGQWRDFPAVLAAACDCGALVYERYGYGGSEGLAPPYRRDPDYLHVEGREILPAVLDQTEIADAVLIGHSDGGSIALLAAAASDARIRGVVSEAAHSFVEAEATSGIRDAVAAFRAGGLRKKLARYHGQNVDSAFYGWANIWLRPDFENFHIEGYLRAITSPVLAVQGANDEYGTPAQLEIIERAVSGPVETMLIPDCGHAPHIEARATVLAAATRFIDTAFGRTAANRNRADGDR